MEPSQDLVECIDFYPFKMIQRGMSTCNMTRYIFVHSASENVLHAGNPAASVRERHAIAIGR